MSDEILRSSNLRKILAIAIDQTHSMSDEEKGGILTQQGVNLKFIHLKNQHAGTPTAKHLWQPSPEDFAAAVLNSLEPGETVYASFHTHPMFPPIASNTDITVLFQGFKDNCIYSPVKNRLVRYHWTPKNQLIWKEIKL